MLSRLYPRSGHGFGDADVELACRVERCAKLPNELQYIVLAYIVLAYIVMAYIDARNLRMKGLVDLARVVSTPVSAQCFWTMHLSVQAITI